MKIVYDSNSASKLPMGFHTFPEVLNLTEVEQARVLRIGELSHSVLCKVNDLAALAMSSDDANLQWLRRLLLGSIPVEHHGLAKELMIKCAGQSPVHLFRADVVGGGQIAELQCPGSGWAYTHALELQYGIPAQESPIIAAYLKWAQGRDLTWWLHEPKHERSVRFLIEECRSVGLNIKMFTTADFNPEDAETIVKRLPLPELISEPKGRRLLRRWLDGQVDMDLLPSMVPETKYLMAIFHHSQFAHLFTEEEKQLAPKTILVESREQVIGEKWGKVITMEYAFERFAKDYILKYGGAQKELRGGCHAVYNLGAGSVKLPERQALLDRAVADWQRGEGWVLQEYNPMKWEVKKTPEDHPMRYFSIFRPHYLWNQATGQVELVRNSITARNDWKVHAQSDSYLGIFK